MSDYRHRNGETEPPMAPGRYWFQGICHGARVQELTTVIMDAGDELLAWRPVLDDGWFESIDHFQGCWWGPVVPPWELTG